ncbi:hypothetical protein D1872_50070 [compost metagenome]
MSDIIEIKNQKCFNIFLLGKRKKRNKAATHLVSLFLWIKIYVDLRSIRLNAREYSLGTD